MNLETQEIHVPIVKGMDLQFPQFRKYAMDADFDSISLSLIGNVEVQEDGVRFAEHHFKWSKDIKGKIPVGKHVARITLDDWINNDFPQVSAIREADMSKEIPR